MNSKKPDNTEEFSDILEGVLVGIQIADGTKYVGEVHKVNRDYIWLKLRNKDKPIVIPRIIIKRTLISLPGDKE